MQRVLEPIARPLEFVIGAFFLAAAALKLANVPQFAAQILSYGIITNPQLVAGAAVVLVPVEALLGVAMLAGLRLWNIPLYAAMAMLLVFSAMIAYAWPEDCGCFGSIALGPVETLWKNVVMFAFVLIAHFGLRHRSSSEPGFHAAWKLLWTLLLGGLAGYYAYQAIYNPKKATPAKPAAVGTVAPAASPPPAQVMEQPAPATPALASATAPPSAPAAGQVEALGEAHPPDAPASFVGYVVVGDAGEAHDLSQGTYLVALLSMTCEHCMETVPDINTLALDPSLPTVVALCNEPDDGSFDQFKALTGPFFPMLSLGNDFLKFSEFIKDKPPRFTLIKDGRPLRSWEQHPPTSEQVLAAVAAAP